MGEDQVAVTDELKMQCDWDRLTAGELAEFQQEPGLVKTQVALLTKVVTQVPWGGDPADPETYISDEVTTGAYERLVEEVTAAKPEPETEWWQQRLRNRDLILDFNRLTTKAMYAFQEQMGRVGGQVEVLKRVIVEMPDVRPEADFEAAILALPLPSYEGLWRVVMEAKANAASNFRAGR